MTASPSVPAALAAADALNARIRATRSEPAGNPQLEALALAVTANQPVLLWGEPGIGKSAGMEQLAAALGIRLETVVASVHEPSDFAGLPIVGDDPAAQGVPMAPPDWAVRLARTGHGLLFFDELSSAPPAVQAALLRVVLERRVGSLELPESVRIVAAANPPSSAADGWHLTPPLANRFVHLDWTHDPRTVARGMAGIWPETALPTVEPGRVPGAVARARGVVSGFLTARPGLVHHMPKDAEGRGRAWPSPRTWEMALRLLATGYASGAGREALAAAVMGAVGEAAGIELLSYLAARYKAAEARPYLASALYALTVVATEQVRTMAVDRHWRCYVAPAFVAETDVEELAGVWIHEASHVLRDHHGRADRLSAADQRDHRRVNIAQDCEINDDLLSDGLRLPEGRMEPRLFGLPTGRLFEEYLPGIPATCTHPVDCGSGAHGVPAPWDLGEGDTGVSGLGPVEADALRRTTAQAVRAHQRSRGSVPAGWRRWAEEVLEPTVDWRKALTGAVREAAAWAGGAVDYTYRRPSRRTPALGGRVVLPSLRRPLPRVAIVVDTSGSMGDDELAAALAEVQGVLREVGVGGNRVAVLACDADVHAVARVTNVDQVELAAGGGTDMTVGIRKALAAPEPPGIVVVLTDGYTPWPPEPLSCRLVVALIGHDAPEPPAWAETIRIPTAQ